MEVHVIHAKTVNKGCGGYGARQKCKQQYDSIVSYRIIETSFGLPGLERFPSQGRGRVAAARARRVSKMSGRLFRGLRAVDADVSGRKALPVQADAFRVQPVRACLAA